MLETAETVKWECRDCQTFRDEPFRFVGQGAPACGRCCQPMTRVPAVLVGDAGIIRDANDLDHALGTMSGAADAMVHDLLARDPDGVMEPMEDDDHE